MLQLNFVRENAEHIKKKLAIRNFQNVDIVDELIEVDRLRRTTQQKRDAQLSESKKLASQIGQLFKQGKQKEADVLKAKTTELKESNKTLEHQLKLLEESVKDRLVLLPNIPHDSVAPGNSDEDNVEVKAGGKIPKLHKDATPHWDLMEKYQLMSLELGTKIAGAGFPVFMGKGARLQRALVAFFLDKATEAGYTEYIPPLLVNETTAFGTGQLPDKEGQMYHVTGDNLFMIPTAEVPVTNVLREAILRQEDLPVKMTAHSQCFRREAGSYGAHVRGLNRVHQFEKVEIVQVTHPTKSYEALDEMVAHVESLLQDLELPYRIMRLCGGDLGFTSVLTYDFEVYSAAQKRWLEVSSVSNFETFQTNRMKIRYRDDNKKTQLTHSLNGSALALPRILAALLENNQTPKGIKIPKALQSYTGFEMIG